MWTSNYKCTKLVKIQTRKKEWICNIKKSLQSTARQTQPTVSTQYVYVLKLNRECTDCTSAQEKISQITCNMESSYRWEEVANPHCKFLVLLSGPVWKWSKKATIHHFSSSSSQRNCAKIRCSSTISVCVLSLTHGNPKPTEVKAPKSSRESTYSHMYMLLCTHFMGKALSQRSHTSFF